MIGAGIELPDPLLDAEAWERLRLVYDPELGVNVVDLGLVYALEVEQGSVTVGMTLTTRGCPLGDTLLQAVERALSTIPGVRGVAVELVWEPPWTPEMMTEPARRALGRT